MPIAKTALVAYTQKQMFDLINDIDNYPKYLPWCSKTTIISCNQEQTTATLYIEYFKFKTHFSTKNINTPQNKIEIQLKDGPFKSLDGLWEFIALGDDGCKINFYLNYEFSNRILEKILNPVFGYLMGTIVNSFVKQAHTLYG